MPSPCMVLALAAVHTLHMHASQPNQSTRVHAALHPCFTPARIPFAINVFSPSGYIDTLYLDEDLRISKGDKGSIFIARRAEKQ